MVCCSPEDFSPCSKSSWPDSSLVKCLGRFLFLRKEHDGTSRFPLLTIAFINVYVSQWILNYLLKLYMASLTWLWCQHGACLPREPEEHTELWQGENHLISLIMSNLQQQHRFCRWQPYETAASLSPASLNAALSKIHQDLITWGNPRRIQISQGFLCSPPLSPPTAWNSLGTEETSPDLPVLLLPIALPGPAGKYCLKTQICFNAQLQQNYLCCHKPGAGFKEDFSSLHTEMTSFEIKTF